MPKDSSKLNNSDSGRINPSQIRNSRAFTLIELLITISIFMIITIVVLINSGKFNNSVIMTNIAYEVALTIREAQNYSLNVKLVPDLDQEIDFKSGFGVNFDLSDNLAYNFFSDTDPIGNGDKIFDPSNDFTIKTYKIKRGYYIKSITAGDGVSTEAKNKINISYKRPAARAYIVDDDGQEFTKAEICIGHPSSPTDISCVNVNSSGLIDVVNK